VINLKKYVLLLTIFLIVGCQSTDNILADQSKDINEIKLSEFEEIDVYNNENNSEIYYQKEKVGIFQEAFKYAKIKNEKKYKTDKFDYNIKFTLSDDTERVLHLAKNEKNELILKYIGDSTERYVVDEKHSKNVIELIYE